MSEIRDVIIACDFSSSGETFSFLEKFGNARPYLKIGMELFYAEGPQIVRALKDRGHKLFLDLKLHDIPNTVRRSMHVLSSLQVDMVNLHAAGTRAMMEAAMEGITRPDGSRPLLIAVTQLTSTDQARLKEELLIETPLEDVVVSYAQNAASAGLDGVVCSPLEADSVHRHCGSDFLAVTPGIRFSDGRSDDQKRVTTPAQAKILGSDFIVVGRPITQSDDPLSAWKRCCQDFI